MAVRAHLKLLKEIKPQGHLQDGDNMQEFWIRLVSLFIVVSSLWGYNMTIDKREQEIKIRSILLQKLKAQTVKELIRMAHTQAVQRALVEM